MIAIGNYIGYLSSGVQLSEEYQAVLDYAATQGYTLPSSSRQSIENAALQIVLDEPGLWGKVKLFVVYHTDGDSNYATLNWKNPNTFQASKVSSPAFTSLQGFRSNGTTSYLNHNFTLAEVNQQSVCYFSKGIDNVATANSVLFGAAAAGISGISVFVNPRNTSDQMQYRVSSSGSTTVVAGVTDATNRICIGRDSGNVFHSINGAAKVVSANAFTTLAVGRNIYSVAYEGNLGAAAFNARGSHYMVITDLLTDAEIAVMDAALALLTLDDT